MLPSISLSCDTIVYNFVEVVGSLDILTIIL